MVCRTHSTGPVEPVPRRHFLICCAAMRSRVVFSLVAFLGALGGGSASWAAQKGGVRLGKLSCVLVREGLVYPLDGGKSPRIYPPSVFRCSVAIVVTGEPRPLPMTMTVKQEVDEKSPPVTAQATQEVHVSPGSQTAELSVAATENMQDCMEANLTVAVGKTSRSLKVTPVDCSD
jgi:hypothetical protein